MSDDLTSTPLRGDGLRLRGFPRGGNVIGARDNLICDKEPALGGSLHRVEIILVGVAAGEEEVVDGGGLRGPQPVLPWDLAVESLAELDHRAPGHLGVKGGGGGAAGALGLVEPNYPFDLPLYFQTSEEKFAPLLFFREKFPTPLS